MSERIVDKFELPLAFTESRELKISHGLFLGITLLNIHDKYKRKTEINRNRTFYGRRVKLNVTDST